MGHSEACRPRLNLTPPSGQAHAANERTESKGRPTSPSWFTRTSSLLIPLKVVQVSHIRVNILSLTTGNINRAAACRRRDELRYRSPWRGGPSESMGAGQGPRQRCYFDRPRSEAVSWPAASGMGITSRVLYPPSGMCSIVSHFFPIRSWSRLLLLLIRLGPADHLPRHLTRQASSISRHNSPEKRYRQVLEAHGKTRHQTREQAGNTLAFAARLAQRGR